MCGRTAGGEEEAGYGVNHPITIIMDLFFFSCVVPCILCEINGSKLLDFIVIGRELFYGRVKASKLKMCLPFLLQCYNMYSTFAGEQCGLC